MSDNIENHFYTLMTTMLIITLLLCCINIVRLLRKYCNNIDIRFYNEPLIINQTSQPSAPPEDNMNMELLHNEQISSIKEIDNANCAICFDKMDKNIIKTPCNHYFHCECLDGWIASNIESPENNCPICRCNFNQKNNQRNDVIINTR